MEALRVVPKIFYFDTFKEFNEEFKIGKNDLVITNEFIYEPYMKPLGIDTNLIFQEKFGTGEPSDEMIDSMTKEMKKYNFDRIIAFGGGTIVDICKILALDVPEKSIDLFEGEVLPKKVKELVVVPTTCGTGSEVTNVAIAELKSKHTKKGLAVEETYADYAVLIPETIKGLPYKFFVTSSVDALIHAIESYLSPKASPFTEMYSLQAIKMIMDGYKKIVDKGEEERFNHLRDFVLASNYAGIAFGNAGCAAVHALSYSIGGAFHVAHGEANYQFFTEVFKMYSRKKPNGKIIKCTKILADALECDPNCDVYGELEKFLNKLIAKKALREYGMVESQIDEFTDSTIANQQRLLANNYVELSREEIREIFANLY
ncbi:TPA: 4-hydroxybutyrate dehydrogenase [Clostridioides difficile]|uniref:4-hydroxybutyrate dehydrogenase (4-hydroxybutanoate:NAD+ oxidoreductase) n=2 Tax=Clostridioides difficile TaxID=1496 RepID=Q185L3_CLOD6|nr:4-hydroxybutyrate dehydrogenase [Clostridioides difficile]EQF63382.1 iron-containing alcohol dehydrogenase family protein [Clostridioides difficile CD196]CCL65379.1 4-hydroxybutyrate dehydrogenase (4-hydroxybutanoate:NAD+ oxidoreductase) [Clostridioides difficile E7]AJP12081.1 NAD-dependent 4-hydroxybutyrate dehydrogenase [Clostridioides difficile 630]ARE63261.1 NAD-dependent 4-hydroxybutyrate dehydrogenase [Clostridioides difficile]AXB65183.1 NAD-dependent 4-hydroxybutyrate dehydrogenase [